MDDDGELNYFAIVLSSIYQNNMTSIINTVARQCLQRTVLKCAGYDYEIKSAL